MPTTPGARPSCYDWCVDFTRWNAVVAFGLITGAVAVWNLVKRPTELSNLFASFGIVFGVISLITCCGFYAGLKRPPWPRSRQERAADQASNYEQQRPGEGAGADCAVCLGEVEKGDAVRRMPLCQHVFHTVCIDQWLRLHATCPVCRCTVVVPPPEVVLDVGS